MGRTLNIFSPLEELNPIRAEPSLCSLFLEPKVHIASPPSQRDAVLSTPTSECLIHREPKGWPDPFFPSSHPQKYRPGKGRTCWPPEPPSEVACPTWASAKILKGLWTFARFAWHTAQTSCTQKLFYGWSWVPFPLASTPQPKHVSTHFLL